MQLRIVVSVVLPFLSTLIGSSDAAQINNSKVAKTLVSAGKVVPNGKYYLRNQGTGQYINFKQRKSAYDIFPSSGKTKIVTKKHGGGTKYIRFSVEEHCFSAQWDEKVDGGADHAAVLYKCVVDPIKKSTLEKTKQWYILVSASFGKRSLDDSEEREWGDEDFPEDFPETLAEDSEVGEEEEEEVEIEEWLDNIHKRDLVKRAAKSVGTFYIIPVDHMKDMATRALTAGSKKTAGGAKSTLLTKWKKGNKKQMWQIIKA